MDLFNLAAKLTLDGGAFDKGMRKATKEGENLAKRLTKSFNTISKAAKAVLGGAVVRTVVGSLKSLVDSAAAFGDAIDKNSQVLGMSRKAYQEWDYILGQNGASIDDMTVAMKTMNSAILDKNEDVTKALQQLGVDLDLLGSLSLEDQFDYLVHQFQQMPAGAQKSALAVTLFGRQGQKLLPTLNSSSESLYDLREEFEALGLYLDDEGVNTAVAYGDAVDTMKRTFNALKVAVGVDLMRTFIPAVKAITDYASQIKKAYEDNGLAGVFQKLVDDVKAIKWPTWEDIGEAIQTGWDTIVLGVEGLTRIVFGENVDGTIKYPTWESIGTAIGNAWNGIVTGVSTLWRTIGKIIFGTAENEDITIEFPTWEDIKQAVEDAWKTIVDGVAGLGKGIGKAVFGQNVDGSIRWPTWDDVGGLVSRGWSSIVSNVEKLTKIAFDILVDIGIPLPDWDTIKSKISEGWGKVEGAFKELLAISFGTKVDGSIDYPSWETIKTKITDGWATVVGAFNELKMLVFGSKVDGKVELPNLTKMKVAAAELWGRFVEWVGKLGGLVFGRDENGEVKWPDWATLEAVAGKLWDGFKDVVGKLGGLIFGRDTNGEVKWPNWDDLKKVAKGAWKLFTGSIAKLGGLIFGRDENGEVNWPNWDQIKGFASKAWQGILEYVAKLPALVFGEDSVISEKLTNAINMVKDVGTWILENSGAVAAALATMFAVNHPVLTALAGLASLVAMNWDEVKPVLQEIGAAVDEYIVSPLTTLFEWIKTSLHNIMRVLGLIDPSWVENMNLQLDLASKGKGHIAGQGAIEALEKELQKTPAELAAELDIDETEARQNLVWLEEELSKITGKTYQLKFEMTGLGRDGIGFGLDDSGGAMTHSGHATGAPVKPDGSHAKGLWTVPFDNYLALLHRGERVATASQARHMGESADSATIAAAVSSAVSKAMQDLSLVLNNKEVGKVVGDSTSKRVHKNIDLANGRKAYSHGR